MALEFKKNKAIFKEIVNVEEAEPLFEWFLKVKKPEVDMTECSHIHTAVLQLLMIFKPKLILPKDEGLKLWLIGF